MTKTEEIRVWGANEGYVRADGKIQHVVVNKITIVPHLDAENEDEQKMLILDCVVGGVKMEIEKKNLPILYANEDDCKNQKMVLLSSTTQEKVMITSSGTQRL